MADFGARPVGERPNRSLDVPSPAAAAASTAGRDQRFAVIRQTLRRRAPATRAAQRGGDAARQAERRTFYMLVAVSLSETSHLPVAASVVLPDAPALVAGFAQAAWLTSDGEIELLLARLRRRAAPDDAAFSVPCARDGAAAQGRRPFPRSTCSSSSLSCGRRNSACRHRAAWRGRSDCRRPKASGRRRNGADRRGAGTAGAARRRRAIRDARAIATAMAAGGWGWGPAVLARSAPDRRFRPAGQWPRWRKLPNGRSRARAAARQPRRSSAPRRAGASPSCSARRRGAAAAGGLRRRGQRRLPPREREDEPQRRAGRGRHRRRQDARAMSRRPACGPRRTRAPVWISTFTRNLQRQIDGELDRLYPDPAEAPPRGDPQGPRELSLPAEFRGGGRAHCRCAPDDAVGLGLHGALGAAPPATATWSAAICRAGCPTCSGRAQHRSARRPARRMHLFGLPALPRCFVEQHVRRARRADIVDRQPCAGHDPGGAGRARRRHAADALRVRRGPSPVRRRRRRVRARI